MGSEKQNGSLSAAAVMIEMLAYLGADDLSASHAVSTLPGEAPAFNRSGVLVTGGFVRLSFHLWISECPSAKAMPPAPL